MDVEIGPLPGQRVRAASLLLARAFADDGILTHYLAGRRGRRIAIPAFFCAVIHEHLATTYAATAGPELVGVLSCAGPDEPRAHLDARIRAWSRLLQVRALFTRSSRQLLAGFRSMERLRARPSQTGTSRSRRSSLHCKGRESATPFSAPFFSRPIPTMSSAISKRRSHERRRSTAAWDSRSSPNRARSKMRGRSAG